MRWLTSSQEPLFDVEPLRIDEDLIEPRFELRWFPEKFDLTLGSRWSQRRERTEGLARVTRTEQDLFGRFATRLERAPDVQVEYDRRTRELGDGADLVDSRLFAEVGYRRPTWSASVGQRRTVNDVEDGLRRETTEDLFDGSVNRRFLDGRLSFFANASASDIDVVDRLPRETLVAVPRVVVQGLAALDPLPEDGALAPEPNLVDGNRSGATPVNIGGGLAGGEIGWNVGVELGLDQFVDVVDLWLADPIPAASATRYQFEVYTSPDNVQWTRQPGVASRAYFEDDGRFRLTFAPVVARFVKVVNLSVDDTLGAVFVSEIEVFRQELRRGTSETATRTRLATANVTWSPFSRLTFALTGFFNRIENDGLGGANRSEDRTGNVSVRYRPNDYLLGSVSLLSQRRERSLLPTERGRILTANLTALPLQDLELSVVFTRQERERADIAGTPTTQSFLFRVATLLYRDLSLAAEYGEADEQSLDLPGRYRESYRLVLDTRPREELQFNTAYSLERIRNAAGSVAPPLEDIVNWTNRLILRPSAVLNVVAQGTWYDIPGDQGWSTVFQVDWVPFQGGAIQLALDYRDDVPVGGRSRTLRTTRLRWNLNRNTFLDIEAGRQRSSGGGAADVSRSLFEVFLQARF